jgi:hypothetical protein
MIKQYEFNNIDKLKQFKCSIILPEIKNGKYITNIYEKIIKEVKIQVFITNKLDKEYMLTNIDINNKLFFENDTTLDYLYNLENIEIYKILVNITIDTNLQNMCIWNLEYSPHISGELIIN